MMDQAGPRMVDTGWPQSPAQERSGYSPASWPPFLLVSPCRWSWRWCRGCSCWSGGWHHCWLSSPQLVRQVRHWGHQWGWQGYCPWHCPPRWPGHAPALPSSSRWCPLTWPSDVWWPQSWSVLTVCVSTSWLRPPGYCPHPTLTMSWCGDSASGTCDPCRTLHIHQDHYCCQHTNMGNQVLEQSVPCNQYCSELSLTSYNLKMSNSNTISQPQLNNLT